MPYHATIPLLAAVATLTLGVVVYRSKGQTALGQVFSFLAIMLVLWNLQWFVLYSVSDVNLALRLVRVFRIGSYFMPPAILHLQLALRPRRSRALYGVLLASYAAGCAFSVANAFGLIVSGLQPFSWGYYLVGDQFYELYSMFALANCLAAIAILVHDHRTLPEPRMRLQVKFWLVGALVALPLGLTNLVPSYGISFYPLGSLGNAVWAGVVAYAIVRHRLMDIDVVATKGIAYAVVSFMLIAPAFAIVLWLQQLAFGRVNTDFSFAVLLMFVAVGVLFPRLRIRAESRIGQSLFREKHEHRAALMAFTRSIVRILDREKLLRELGTTLSDTLQLDRIAIALADDAKRAFTVRYAIGAALTANEFPEEHAFITALMRRQEAVLRDEIEASASVTERSVVAEVCQRNGWEVCIPLTVGGKLIGFISLGYKRNLDAYFAEDLELLGTLGAEASVALENARLYEELKKSHDIIRRADRLSALGTLAAGIAHEVRNPLVSIQTFFQLAPDRLHDEEFFTTFLGMAATEVKRISDLITELLSFARSATRSLGPVNLNELVDRVATLLDPEARKHQLTMLRALSPNTPLINADGDQIKQVVINLILNAIQATEPGGTVSITTRSVDHQNGEFGQLEIRDTGIGIPPERLDHIFDPFFTTKDKGTGLGLAIAHQIVTEHGGSITVESHLSRGTSFCVNLPPYEASAPHAPAEDHAEMEPLPLLYTRPRKIASS